MPAFSREHFLKIAGATLALAPATSFAAGAEPVQTRPIPHSKDGERITVVGLGTQPFSRRGDEAAMQSKAEVLKVLLSSSPLIDTAAGYGEAEVILGELIAKMIPKPKTFIVSKFGRRGREEAMKTIDASFQRLQVPVIDVMIIHNMQDAENHVAMMRELKASGRIRYIGISSTDVDSQDEMAPFMEKHDAIDFCELNYAADVRGPEKRLLPVARDRGVAILCALPFGRRRLLSAPQIQGKPVPEWAAKELGVVSYAQMLLKFDLGHPAVTAVIPGTTNPKHMAENLDAGRGVTPDEKQRERIAAIWESA
jgi:aryl-alcohol dehydrogenase-like predicted oxidoreductase